MSSRFPGLRSLLFWLATLAIGALGPAARAEDGAATVPLTKVVLFSSGVGYFEHDGPGPGRRPGGNEVQDREHQRPAQEHGRRRTSAAARSRRSATAPRTRSPRPCKSFAIDLTANPTLAATARPGPRRAGRDRGPQPRSPGSILGVETRQEGARQGQDASNVEVLNLLTDDGLRSIALGHGQPHQVGQREARRRAAQGPGPAGQPRTPRTRRRSR